MAKPKVSREDTLAALAALPRVARVKIGKAIHESAEMIADGQRRLVPVKSGDLKRSIEVVKGDVLAKNHKLGVTKDIKGDPELTATVVAGDSKAFYAAMVEFGTKAHLLQWHGKNTGPKHPGAKPKGYFFPIYRAMRKKVKAKVARSFVSAARHIAKHGTGSNP